MFPASPRFRVVTLALVGFAVLLVASVRTHAEPVSDEKAEAALKRLSERAGMTSADSEKLRQDILAFRRSYPGTTSAAKAAALLTQLSSALDKLDPKTLPRLDRFDWQPKELVAVLGEHRGRHGAPVSCAAFSPDGK